MHLTGPAATNERTNDILETAHNFKDLRKVLILNYKHAMLILSQAACGTVSTAVCVPLALPALGVLSV